jgi:hypothetical protein
MSLLDPERPNHITLAIHAPALPVTKEEAEARAAMIKRFGNPAMLPEVPYESPKPALPKLSDEIAERRILREQIAEGEKRIAELKRQLEAK